MCLDYGEKNRTGLCLDYGENIGRLRLPHGVKRWNRLWLAYGKKVQIGWVYIILKLLKYIVFTVGSKT